MREHVAACAECRHEWERYRRVFEVVASTPSFPAPRFVHPNEMARPALATVPRTSWFRTQAFRAAAVLLLITSHSAIFLIGRTSGGDEPAPGPAVEPPPVHFASHGEGEAQTRRRQALRDHTDAADLFIRQIDNLQTAGAPGVELARANLDLLRPERLISGDDQSELEKELPGTGEYLSRIADFRTSAAEWLGNTQAPVALKRLQLEVERQRLAAALAPLQSRLQNEATGHAWARNLGDSPQPSPGIRPFFAAQNQMLVGHFGASAEAFHRFVWANPHHPLARVAKMMECEAWVRQRRFDRAFPMLANGGFVLNGRGTPTDFLGNFVQIMLIRPDLQLDPAALLPPVPTQRRLQIIIRRSPSSPVDPQ